MSSRFAIPTRRSTFAAARILMLLRLFVLTICLLIGGIGYVSDANELVHVFFALNFVVILSTVYFFLLLWLKKRHIPRFILFQILFDVLIATVLIFLTGGLASPFSFLYFLIILAAAISLSLAMSIFVTCLSVILMSLITVLYRINIGPAEWVRIYSIMSMREFVTMHLTHSFGLFLLAGLVGMLTEHLSRVRLIHALMLERIADGVMLFDSAGKLKTQNDAAAALLRELGIDPKAGPVAFDAVVGAQADKVMEGLSAYEIQTIDRNIKDRSYRFNCTKTDEISGLPSGFLITVVDWTAERQLSDARIQMNRMAAISELGTSIAHEIRNPLATIRGLVQELGKHFADESDRFKRMVGLVLRESDRMDGIITSFLRYSRMRQPVPGNLRMVDHVDEFKLMLSSREEARGVNIQIKTIGDPVVKTDEEQLRQVLLNLAVNSFFALQDIPNPMLEIVFRDSGDEWVEYEVIDNGCGIPDGIRNDLFEPFVTTRTDGTGMGLAIVRRIIDMNGGTIECRDNPGGGTVFFGKLPAAEAEIVIGRRIDTRNVQKVTDADE